MNIKTAIAQTDIAWRDVDCAKQNAVRFFDEAAGQNTELIVFPEMSFTGFSFEPDEACSYSVELTEFMSDCSKKYKINSIFGFAELNETGYQNMCAAISKDGDIISKYAKIHPLSFSKEERDYTGGNNVVTFTQNGVCFSMLICYDIRFPELFQAVSNDASVIIVIANWPEIRIKHWELLLRARALENQCYIIGANRVGSMKHLSYSGGSQIISPKAEVLCSAYGKETLLVYDLDTAAAASYREQFPLKKDRKNHIYRGFYD